MECFNSSFITLFSFKTHSKRNGKLLNLKKPKRKKERKKMGKNLRTENLDIHGIM